MASPIYLLSIFLLILHFHLTLAQAAVAGGELIFEDGYKVSTVLDGDKSNIKVNPQYILHQSPPSDLFILLDSVASTFYTLSLSTTSNETVMKRLAGNGKSGYMDGDLASAMFNKPTSFAVDFNGNLYVADHHNYAIRKITKSGVTTIAGGYSQKPGRTDGPARDASFSDNFELVFIPQLCALMISDHGTRLVHQINLKAADCTRDSRSVLGSTSLWLLGLGFSCLLSLVIGFVTRPYVIAFEGIKLKLHYPSWTWTHCLTSLGRQITMLCSGIRSVVVKTTTYLLFRQMILLSLSQVSLMIRPMRVELRTTCVKPVNLLDIDEVYTSSSSSSSSIVISPLVSEQLKDLLTFDGGQISPVNTKKVVERESSDVLCSDQKTIDGMIEANLVKFEEQCPILCSPGCSDCSLGLVKRR